MGSEKDRMEAMPVAAKTDGVDRVAIPGDAKDQFEVIGTYEPLILYQSIVEKLVHIQFMSLMNVKESAKDKSSMPAGGEADSSVGAFMEPTTLKTAQGLISEIMQAAQTAYVCKVQCEDLVQNLRSLDTLLPGLQLEDPKAAQPLARLGDTLIEVRHLVMGCQGNQFLEEPSQYFLDRFKEVISRFKEIVVQIQALVQ